MKVLLLKYWDRMRASFWFLPIVMASAALLLAYACITFDRPLSAWLALHWDWQPSGGVEGAGVVLGTISGSTITIAGMVFSMTMVALSLASTQLGPRIQRNLMRDTRTQVVLGISVATFLYCLMVLRTLRHADTQAFVPHLSVSLGVLLAVLNVGALIYFLHHVSVSVQANEIVARISAELIEEIERLFPEQVGRGAPRPSAEAGESGFLEAFDWEALAIGAENDGYLQFIDLDDLLELATEADLVLRLDRHPGHYVVDGQPLVLAWPGNRVDEALVARIRAAFVQGNQRTPRQDIECAVNQLVEIALRALSPSLNDPFTAIACVDHLGSVLCRLARCKLPSPYRYDEAHLLRMIAPSISFAQIVAAAFDPIRQCSQSSMAVTVSLLDSIAVIAGFAELPEDLAALQRQADMIARGARRSLAEVEDRRLVAERYLAACRQLRAQAAGN